MCGFRPHKTDLEIAQQIGEYVMLVRVFATLAAVLAMALFAAPFASAEPTTPVTTEPSVPPKPPTTAPWAPDGLDPMPAPHGPPEYTPPTIVGGNGQAVPPPMEFAPSPDDPGTWIPDPDATTQPESELTKALKGLAIGVPLGLIAGWIIKRFVRMPKVVPAHAPGAVELTKSVESPFVR